MSCKNVHALLKYQQVTVGYFLKVHPVTLYVVRAEHMGVRGKPQKPTANCTRCLAIAETALQGAL